METCEIVMTRDKQGYPEKGTALTVGRLRAYRWCNEMNIAKFKSKKEAVVQDEVRVKVAKAK